MFKLLQSYLHRKIFVWVLNCISKGGEIQKADYKSYFHLKFYFGIPLSVISSQNIVLKFYFLLTTLYGELSYYLEVYLIELVEPNFSANFSIITITICFAMVFRRPSLNSPSHRSIVTEVHFGLSFLLSSFAQFLPCCNRWPDLTWPAVQQILPFFPTFFPNWVKSVAVISGEYYTEIEVLSLKQSVVLNHIFLF